MSVHGCRNWKAIETTDFGGGNRTLTVTGYVEVGASNEEPVLTEAVPQGINPKILILELGTTTTGSEGATVLTWKDAKFAKPVEEGEYTRVDIRGYAVIDVTKQIS